jgi:hypothetical protein
MASAARSLRNRWVRESLSHSPISLTEVIAVRMLREHTERISQKLGPA